jgi:hypothetical protein
MRIKRMGLRLLPRRRRRESQRRKRKDLPRSRAPLLVY